VAVARSSSGGGAIRYVLPVYGCVTFGRNGLYDDAWKAEPLTYYHDRRCDTGAESDVYKCLVFIDF